MISVLLILVIVGLSESRIWTKDYVNELILLKNHIDKPIEEIFNDLFKHMKSFNHTMKLQAFSLDTLSRILSTGTPFCHSFEAMINHLVNRIQFLILRKDKEEDSEFTETLNYLNKDRIREKMNECHHYLEHHKDSPFNKGILSHVLINMNSHRKEAQKKLTINMT